MGACPPLSPHTKVAFSLPHVSGNKRKKIEKKVRSRSDDGEREGGSEKVIFKGKVLEEEHDRCGNHHGEHHRCDGGKVVDSEENHSSEESSTFSDGDEGNPPFIR